MVARQVGERRRPRGARRPAGTGRARATRLPSPRAATPASASAARVCGQRHRIGRGQARPGGKAGRDQPERAEACRRPARERPELAQEIDRAGLAVGAGDGDQRRRLRAGERRRRSGRGGGAAPGSSSSGRGGTPGGQAVPGGASTAAAPRAHRIGDERASVRARARERRRTGSRRRTSPAVGGHAAQTTERRDPSRTAGERRERLGPGEVAGAPSAQRARMLGRRRRLASCRRSRIAGTVGTGEDRRRKRRGTRCSDRPRAIFTPAGRPGCSGIASAAWITAASSSHRQQAEHRRRPRDHLRRGRRHDPAGGGVAMRAGVRLRLVQHHVDGVARRVHREHAHEGGDAARAACSRGRR